MDYRNIPALCINLDRRTDRWARVQARFEELEWPVERVSALMYEGGRYQGLHAAQAATLDSHRVCWRLCVERGYDVMAVFEDDAVFPSDFKDIFPVAYSQLPPDWRFWQLHSTRASTEPVSDYIVKILSYGWGTHGYFVTNAGCQDLLAIQGYNNCDYFVTADYLKNNGQPYGMPLPYALCFQEGENDSDIPATQQSKFWREQRLKYCR